MRRMCTLCGEIKDWSEPTARCPECLQGSIGASHVLLDEFEPHDDPLRDADERREFADRMSARLDRLVELRMQRRATIVDRIARDFAAALRDDLPEALWLDMKHRNVANIGTGVCASHDFCDANMVMEPAFRRHMGHTPDGDSERDASIWSDAWRLAQRRDLTDTRRSKS